MSLNKILRKNIRRTLMESDDRDAFLNITKNSGTYDVTNANDLTAMFFDPSRKINKGAFVTIVYVSEASAIKKTFNNGGFDNGNGNVMSPQEIEQQGRALGKDYINNFYDSDEYQRKLSKKQGGKRPFAVFTTVTEQVNWGAMNYDVRQNAIDDVFANASDEDLNDYAAHDADFMKRIAKFKSEYPEMADEIDQYISMGAFPRDIINKIRKTKLQDNGKGWNRLFNNPYVWRNGSTGNEALRVTKSSNLPKKYTSYVVMSDGQIKRISDEEYFHLANAFGRQVTKTSEEAVNTSVRNAIDAIENRYEFQNRIIPQIAKMTFTIDGKPVTYKNHELNVGGIIIDADDFLNSPMTEHKRRGRKVLKESDIRRMVRNILMETHRR